MLFRSNQEIRIILQRMPLRKRRGLLKKNLNLHKKEQPGQKSLVSPPAADLMPREEDLTREKILAATLKLQARKLEIPVAHHSALE